MSRPEMQALGWDELDILLITGDAYVDHPAFGVALLGRWLVAHGFRVGICAQPRWQTVDDLLRMGRPRLFAGITAGALDSMLAHYTAFRKKRHDDAYTPGGKAGARPNRACVVYANLARRAFPGLPLVLGGIEASLRRITHYDFWVDALRRPILFDAKADLLIYGMGEQAILETARRCAAGENLTHIPGTAWISRVTASEEGPKADDLLHLPEHTACLSLPSHEIMESDPHQLMQATLRLEQHVHRGDAYAVQMVGNRALVLAPPPPLPDTALMDRLYALPFQRRAHPSYLDAIPADEMLRTSITSHRGCGGGCSFCSLALHQGRRIASRSEASLVDEAKHMAAQPRFSGSISDVGGPTANMWQGRCTLGAACRRSSCCHPTVCKSFLTPQKQHVQLLRKILALPGIKHVRVASGIRADLALHDSDAVRAYTVEFTGGQLKVAPEHCAAAVLDHMRKPPLEVFERFLAAFQQLSHHTGREQYVIPYLMSAFPGCTDEHMYELSRWLKLRHWTPQQVQCFIPTPGTVATAMFYSGADEKGQPLYVARTDADRLRQHRILMPDVGRDPRLRALRSGDGPAAQRPSRHREAGTEHGKGEKHPARAGKNGPRDADRPARPKKDSPRKGTRHG